MYLGGVILGENVVTSSSPFETRAIPLNMVPPFAMISFVVGNVIYGLVRYPEFLQQPGLAIGAMVFVIFWGSLLCLGVITLIFYKIRIEEDGITLRAPIIRIIGYRSFPMYLGFDEIRVKPVWGGRILGFVSGEETKLIRKILLFGGLWVMPFRWRKCLEIIRNFKPSSVTRT